MNFSFYLPTRILFGKDCVAGNKEELGRLGTRVLIVTGKRSGRESGALQDISNALDSLGLKYEVFDKVENNPSLRTVEEGGRAARRMGADLIVGIGGGSPLDASKAVAVLGTNEMDPMELYKNVYPHKPLPVVAIPTTAGTGSEVTPYVILTRDDLETKMSFGNRDLFPVLAFMDPRYTQSMPWDVTVDTAVDALSHAMEGYLSKASTPASDMLAMEAISLFGRCLPDLEAGHVEGETREQLLYAAMLGGMVISHTGTTIVHGMGYNLTYFKGFSHGRANGVLMAEYLRFNRGHAAEKVDRLLRVMGLRDIEEFDCRMRKLLPADIHLEDGEISKYASITMKQKSTSRNPRPVTADDIAGILTGISRR